MTKQYTVARQDLKALYANVVRNKLSFSEYLELSKSFWNNLKRDKMQVKEYEMLISYARGCYFLIVDTLIYSCHQYTTRAGNLKQVKSYIDLPEYVKKKQISDINFTTNHLCWASDHSKNWS